MRRARTPCETRMLPRLLWMTAGLAALAQDTTFRTTVPVVVAPAVVKDAKGHYIDGLQAADFVLFEDGKPRPFQLDTSDTVTAPLTVVVAIQANSTAPAALLRIRKVGSMLQPLITGERGSAAVLAFGSEVAVVQDFTSDADRLIKAFRGIRTQPGRAAVMLDALSGALRMFETRPSHERRVLIVIGESKDRGSKTRLEDVVKTVQARGVAVFPVTFSAYAEPFLTKASELPLPDPPMNLIEAARELSRLGKADAAQLLATYSGGRKSSFATLRTLEQIVTSVGEELHSQYIFSYTNPVCTPGPHRIEVRVVSRPGALVRARYGYWTDSETCQSANEQPARDGAARL